MTELVQWGNLQVVLLGSSWFIVEVFCCILSRFLLRLVCSSVVRSCLSALSTSVRVVATTGNPRRLVIRLNERHHAVVRRTVQPLHRLQKLSSGGQQGELLSLGKRLYGGPFSSRSQRQLAVDANS